MHFKKRHAQAGDGDEGNAGALSGAAAEGACSVEFGDGILGIRAEKLASGKQDVKGADELMAVAVTAAGDRRLAGMRQCASRTARRGGGLSLPNASAVGRRGGGA